MSLQPGRLIGPYQVVAPLGAGGMGEVWKARDTRLGRDVALKVLPDLTANDPKALARFQSEAKAVAALSHPNILALHDVGEAEGIHFAVTELLEGEPLRALVARGPAPARRALEIAGQVADALAAAHEKGIVHRDVKPENVFLTKDGRVKLLDFGLARHESTFRDPGDTHSPTVSAHTEAGAVLGTVAYMSPEQASGKPVDHRSDQFSLGTVLYELLAGKRPFRGATAAETLTAIIREEPEPLSTGSPPVPAPVRWLVERCLAKEPEGRYDSTRDLAREISTCAAHLSEGSLSTAATGPAAPAAPRRRRLLVPGLLAAALAASVLATALVTTRLVEESMRASTPVARLELRLPEGQFLSEYRQPFALSLDGRLVVYSAWTWKTPFSEANSPQLFLRPLDSFEARPIPGTAGGIQPVFSPDGRHVAFATVSEKGSFLKRVPVGGGPVSTICQCDPPYGMVWTSDGHVLFAEQRGPLKRVHAAGGTPEAITTLDTAGAEVSHRLPHLLEDGRTVLYTSLRWVTIGNWKNARVYAWRPGETGRNLVAEWGADGRWVPPGHVVFAREGRLFAVPFDTRTLRPAGTPVSILEGVAHSIFTGHSSREIGAAMTDLSGNRTFAWVSGSVTPEREKALVWIDGSGRERPVDIPKGPFVGARLSPDGERIVAGYGYPGRQLEVFELSRGTRRAVTGGMEPTFAIWGPGASEVTFSSNHEGPRRIYVRKIDAGSDDVEALDTGPNDQPTFPGAWSRDGAALAFVRATSQDNYDIWLLEKGKGLRPVAASRAFESHPDISPDGRWLVFWMVDTDPGDIFVKPLAGEGPLQQVSVGGGIAPLWARDGSAILYWKTTSTVGRYTLFRVRVTPSAAGLSLGRPEKLLEAPYSHAQPVNAWDLAPDGGVLIVKQTEPADSRAWFEKTLTDRIRVDLGGLSALIEEAGRAR